MFSDQRSTILLAKQKGYRLAAASFFLVAATLFGQATYQFSGPARSPDPNYTPGVVRTHSSKQVCHTKTKQFRQTTESMKLKVFREYGQANHAGVCNGSEGCEIDHLIPLELGGADVVANLWPQSYVEQPGAHEKDLVENYLHRQVCSGKLSLREAQKQIATNWYKIYIQMPR